MNLSTAQMSLLFAGCVLAIGGLFVGWRRGVFGTKPTDAPTEAGVAHTGKSAK